MNENLTQMVKDAPATDDAVVFSEADLDLPTEEEVQATEETQAEETPQANVIGIAPLSDWFEANCANFDNINQVKVAIRGVNADKTLIMAVKDPSGEQDSEGHDMRNLRVYENADAHPVLNIPGASMDVYNNGFKIVYAYDENIHIKCYGVRTGLIAVFCLNIGGNLIPYATTRVKKKDTELEVVTKDPADITSKLTLNADLEALQLLYKQSSKAVETLTTNQDVVDWMLTRQAEVTDINHHLQIDGVLIDILA